MAGSVVKRYWGVSIGEGGRYVPQAVNGNFIAIGWDELGDLQAWERRRDEEQNRLWDEFRAFYRKVVPSETLIQSGIQAGQVASFVLAVRPHDIALVRDPLDRRIHIAEVVGRYQHVKAPQDGCPYRNRRQVRWIRRVERRDLPEPLKTSLFSLLTIFNLDKHRDAIEELIHDEKPRPRPVAGDLVGTVKERLMGMPPHDFQQFVAEILGAVGFMPAVNRIGPDGGVDVIGTLNADNLAEIALQVQVKRIAGNTGIKEILQLRGTLGEQEHGAFVTLAGFTKAAREEAEAPGRKRIKLIDGEALVELVLKHYDELSDRYRQLLGVERREMPLKDQFAISTEERGDLGSGTEGTRRA
jgi:restriction system protein